MGSFFKQNIGEATKNGLNVVRVLVTIALLGTLASVAAVSLYSKDHMVEARNAQRLTDLTVISNALYQYYIDFRSFPDSIPLSTFGCNSIESHICQTRQDCSGVSLDELTDHETYLAKIPKDPHINSASETGYYVSINENDRLNLCALLSEGNQIINIIR